MEILRFPLTRFTIFFIPGIVWAYYAKPNIGLLVIASIICFAIFGLALITARRHLRQKIYFGLMICATAFLGGTLSQAAHAYYNEHNHYALKLRNDEKINVVCRIDERLKNSISGARYIANVISQNTHPTAGKILLHFKNFERLPIGTKIIATAQIIPNAKPLNPSQFDYGKYLNDKSIPAQLYLQKSNYKAIGTDKNLSYYADRLRNNMIAALRRSGFGESELQVLHALILGQQQEISREIVKDYQFAGAVHILSVSGLHVGFIMLFVNFVLSRLPKTRRWNAVSLALVLLSLWSFAFIAGLSPSVVRSATMFSFVAVGINLRRSTNTFHTLIVSLLLILVFEPAFIFDVGFQLSYAALFFIVWLQPMLSQLWMPNNRIVKYFWDILTVSFAAQIGTLPLSIYYFHQFPALFFATNLIVIPMLSIIMALGIIVMLPAAFGCIVPFLTNFLEWGIAMLNKSIAFIASFEQFVFTDIPCNFYMLLCGYCSLVAVIIWFKKPSAVKMNFAAIALLLFQLSVLGSMVCAQRQSEFIVCNVSKNTLILVRKGKTISSFGKSTRMITGYAVANFCNRFERFSLQHTYWFANKKILLLNKGARDFNIDADVIILSHSPRINLERWIETRRPEMIVADASNYKTDVIRWKATCQKQKIPFHYTREKGFFKLSELR
jgi:competence protein ComEC